MSGANDLHTRLLFDGKTSKLLLIFTEFTLPTVILPQTSRAFHTSNTSLPNAAPFSSQQRFLGGSRFEVLL